MARKKLDTAGLIDDAAERANDVEPASTSKRRQRAPLKPERAHAHGNRADEFSCQPGPGSRYQTVGTEPRCHPG